MPDEKRERRYSAEEIAQTYRGWDCDPGLTPDAELIAGTVTRYISVRQSKLMGAARKEQPTGHLDGMKFLEAAKAELFQGSTVSVKESAFADMIKRGLLLERDLEAERVMNREQEERNAEIDKQYPEFAKLRKRKTIAPESDDIQKRRGREIE